MDWIFTDRTDDIEDLPSVKTFNLTLGRRPLNALLIGTLYNSSVMMICNNNANLTDLQVRVICGGTVYFGLDENVTLAEDGQLDIWTVSHTLYTIIDLPDGINGIVRCDSEWQNTYLMERQGWYRDGFGYETPETTRPLVDLHFTVSENAYLWLYD